MKLCSNCLNYACNSFGRNTWKFGIIKRIPVVIALAMPEIVSVEICGNLG